MATKTRRLADFLANIDDDSRVTSAGLLDATITASDLADDSVGTAEIIDDAVTAAAIADDAVGAAALASNAVTSAKIADANITAAKLSSTALASVENVKPHIKPETLHPAWSGLLEDNTGYAFTDSSATAHAITSVGDPHHSGAQEKVGSTSLKFDGSSLLHFGANHADFQFGSGDFTIEFWFNLQSHVSSGDNYIGPSSLQFGTSNGFRCIVPSGTPRAKLQTSIGSSVHNLTGTTAIATGTWYHFAAVRIGTSLKLYLNGTQEASATVSGSHDHGNAHANRVISIGARQSHVTNLTFDQKSKVHVDEVRIVKGLGVYTANFTAPTAALTTTWGAATGIAANSTASNVKLLIHSDNGGHVGAYGTAQADGHKYYYTDIKGSKAIKDPRIGAHFGTQRHRVSSMQILEQETATHGKNVFSIDGREWMRFIILNATPFMNNSDGGISLTQDNGANGIYEITGYFNNFNVLVRTTDNRVDDVNVAINGGATRNSADTDKLGGKVTSRASGKLGGRYVNEGSLINHHDSNVTSDLGTTPTINTLRFEPVCTSGEYFQMFGIELTAQDTTSTANKSKIQIPAQNVVSYGKKFAVSAAAHHYNPFAFAGDGTTAVNIGNTTSHGKVADGWTGSTATYFDSTLDTATSLGLSAWETGGDFYRPVNGGRVVKWVDSSGNIKTSVNMMPPTGTAIVNASDAALPTSHAWTTVYEPKLSSTTIDHSQAEVAKTFHWREFGNGNANGGVGGTWNDASMLDTNSRDWAFVMDDGLTGICANDVRAANGIDFRPEDADDFWLITFIGTGISIRTTQYAAGIYHIAQNLPYGTHILKGKRDDDTTPDYYIDGVAVEDVTGGTYAAGNEITIHQPKMPPIPENAVVIADYMLMADFVRLTGSATATLRISIGKGVRRVSPSRDLFYESSAAGTFALSQLEASQHPFKMNTGQVTSGDTYAQLPAFCTNAQIEGYNSNGRLNLTVDGGSAVSKTGTSVDDWGDVSSLAADITLGAHTIRQIVISGSGTSYMNMTAWDVVTPIHTSSHYQAFETPFLYEIQGGDRNMEQTNLVVTADGKTWDQVTRDISYIGNTVVSAVCETDSFVHNDGDWIFEETRGNGGSWGTDLLNKDWIPAWNRHICLRDGWYTWYWRSLRRDNMGHWYTKVNGTYRSGLHHRIHDGNSNYGTISATDHMFFKRGDYIQIYDEGHGGLWSHFYITRQDPK